MKMISRLSVILLVAASVSGFAQDAPSAPKSTPTPAANTAAPDASAQQNASSTTPAKTPDRAKAYYHYELAHMYEETVAMTGRMDYVTKAIDELRSALEYDPDSSFLNSQLAEFYARSGRIRDAVLQAQSIIQRDPKNLDARRLLGRIYLRSLGDLQAGSPSQNMLKLAIEQYEQIVKLDPSGVDDHLLLGRLYRLDNSMAKAESEFKTAVKLDPTSEEAVTTLAYLYNEEGDFTHALATLQSVPEASRTGKLYAALGYTYEQKKDYKDAVKSYRMAVSQDSENLDAVRGLAQNLMNDNQLDAALDQYNAIVEADPQDAQTFLRIAEIYRREGKFQQALDSLKKAQALVPDSQEVPYNMAVIYDSLGRYDDAIQTIQDLLKKTEHADGNYSVADSNNRAIFLERLGSVYREQNKTQQSVDAFRQMLTLGTDNAVRGYQQMIETYRDAKQWPQATAVAEEAVKKIPANRDLQMILAGQEADMGQADQALARVKAMLKGTPDDRDVYISLAQMYSRLKRWPEAEDAISKALQLEKTKDDKDYALFIQGSIFERQKKYDQAEDVFRKVITDDPLNAAALNYLGYMLADRNTRLDEALGYIRRAVMLDPQNGAYLDSLGWIYYKMGKYDLAEANLRKAIDRIGDDPTVNDHIADLYQHTGRLQQAVVHWERAIAEWKQTIPAEVEASEMAKVQKKLDNARMKLAKQENTK